MNDQVAANEYTDGNVAVDSEKTIPGSEDCYPSYKKHDKNPETPLNGSPELPRGRCESFEIATSRWNIPNFLIDGVQTDTYTENSNSICLDNIESEWSEIEPVLPCLEYLKIADSLREDVKLNLIEEENESSGQLSDEMSRIEYCQTPQKKLTAVHIVTPARSVGYQSPDQISRTKRFIDSHHSCISSPPDHWTRAPVATGSKSTTNTHNIPQTLVVADNTMLTISPSSGDHCTRIRTPRCNLKKPPSEDVIHTSPNEPTPQSEVSNKTPVSILVSPASDDEELGMDPRGEEFGKWMLKVVGKEKWELLRRG